MKYVAKSDVGQKRTNNEDNFLAKEFNKNVALFIVADGLGGYLSGEVASGIITETISLYIEEYIKVIELESEKRIKEILKEAILKANKKIYQLEKTDSKYSGMGTTVVAVLKVNDKMFYTSIGDTRLYYIDNDFVSINQITIDDTYVNELLKTNVITKKEALNHPQKHVLTKAIGIFESLDFEIKLLEQEEGYLLLCSDGLTNMLTNTQILNIIKKHEFNNIADKLVLKANENGGVDNITVILIKRGE